ncbi:hypothetical protein OsccyDRAFT_2210 [Leptolyngbyaceae cyanobacterium JSC-12]|nr:hypothetical protein OsccyDRAFT_2210 [Leptolyngbyaceae cyanobacterium JSC-12]
MLLQKNIVVSSSLALYYLSELTTDKGGVLDARG